MLFHGLALAVVGFYKSATVAHRRLGLGESIQLQESCSIRVERIGLFPALEDRFQLATFYQLFHTLVEQRHQ
jgi:hypothetical protein